MPRQQPMSGLAAVVREDPKRTEEETETSLEGRCVSVALVIEAQDDVDSHNTADGAHSHNTICAGHTTTQQQTDK